MFGRLVIVALATVLAWAIFVRPTEGAGPQRVYVVQPGDTLWTIARALQPAGEIRALVDQLADRHEGAALRPGQVIHLP